MILQSPAEKSVDRLGDYPGGCSRRLTVNRDEWNACWSGKHRPHTHDGWEWDVCDDLFTAHVPEHPGCALDLACGSGANAVWHAQRGCTAARTRPRQRWSSHAGNRCRPPQPSKLPYSLPTKVFPVVSRSVTSGSGCMPRTTQRATFPVHTKGASHAASHAASRAVPP